MARSNLELSRGLRHRSTSIRHGSSPKHFKSISSGDASPQHQGGSSPSTSPRTSPGLLAGHYAGCKFTEPPLPSALPPPPQHWMQAPHHGAAVFHHQTIAFVKQEPEQLAHQLKILLKVQA